MPFTHLPLARAVNRITKLDSTTSDKDVLSRRWLPIDIDPVRPSGISSTKSEHAAAHARAQDIQEWLSDQGWPTPLYADSGNGAHLLYRIDLPNDTDSAALVQRCLQALQDLIDDKQNFADLSRSALWLAEEHILRKEPRIPGESVTIFTWVGSSLPG